jgi:RNA polymerase sigma-70 factor (ECF subfamily)
VLGTDNRSEAALIRQAIKGSRAAFGALVEPHSARLISLAGRMLGGPHQAEDAVQDALASVWIARHRLDPQRPVGPFLTTVVLNKCRDRLRKRKAARLIGLDTSNEMLTVADDSPDPEEIATQRDALRRLTAEIERLPIRLREALVLVSMDDRSQAEAAALLGVSEKTVETRIYRARKRLRERLKEF